MRRKDMPLGEILRVREENNKNKVNELLSSGEWILLDAKIIQLGPESPKASSTLYILGRKSTVDKTK